jgi:hypothetical protein
MRIIRRPFTRTWSDTEPVPVMTLGGGRPIAGAMTPVMSPLPIYRPGGGSPFSGMDPSDPATYVRPWRPAPGMIGYLNFDGAAVQGDTEMGGVWGAPASQSARAGVRPKRRPR